MWCGQLDSPDSPGERDGDAGADAGRRKPGKGRHAARLKASLEKGRNREHAKRSFKGSFKRRPLRHPFPLL